MIYWNIGIGDVLLLGALWSALLVSDKRYAVALVILGLLSVLLPATPQ